MMSTSTDVDLSREERDNFFRLTLLLYHLGNSKLRECLTSLWPRVHQNANKSLPTPWGNKPSDAAILKPILKLRFQFKKQEQHFDSGNTDEWDLSLLSLVLSSRPYCAVLGAAETKALKDIKEIRNTLIGHAPDARISHTVFTAQWKKACKALERYNATQEEFDAVEEDIKKPVDILYSILKECCKTESEILKIVNDMEGNAKDRHKEVMAGISNLTEKVESLNTERSTNEPKPSKVRRLQMKEDHRQILQENIKNFDFMATDVLEYLPCLTEEERNDIAYAENNYLPSKAVETLVEKLEEHEEGFSELLHGLRKAGLGRVAVLLDGDSGIDQGEEVEEEESSLIFYKNARVADIRATVHILKRSGDGREEERQLDLEKKIATLFKNTRSSEFKDLSNIIKTELPAGVYFARIKMSNNRRGGVFLVFRVAKQVDDLESFYKEKTLQKLLKKHLLPKALEGIQDGEIGEEDLDFKIVFEEKDFKAIKRLFDQASETSEKPGTSADDDVPIDEPMETEPPKKLSLARRKPRRKVYLDDGDYDLSRELQLRDYQKELAAPALEGKNTIICAPTNSGKTFVAMEITKKHLDNYKDVKEEGKEPKVVFVVDKQNLVLQQKGRFEEYLTNYRTGDITGAGSEAQYIPLEILLQENDIVVLTAQILVNAVKEKKVSISDITLLVFDECHHANKDHPYNKIMQTYLDLKMNGSSEPKTLPQVIGLTASLGVGQSSKEEKAKEHVLYMCANLDASTISTVQKCVEGLKKAAGGDMLDCRSVQVIRKSNIFEQEINKNMEEIEIFIKRTPPTTNREVESYRQWIETLENDATEMENNDHFICAQRLRRYHEALLINSNVRITDAILNLDKYFNGLDQSKFNETERMLQESFIKTKERIEKYMQEAGIPENALLKTLQDQIMGFHAKAADECQAIGILFTRTREYAYALKRWIEETEELKEVLIPEVLLGSAEMTQAQQEQVIQKFKNGTVNIIIATTVAEEGLDIPECNYVIRYGVKGNEISFVQSRGRIRAEEGKYVHLSEAKSRGAEHEQRNQYREMLMQLAVQEAQKMEKDEFLKKIAGLQKKSTLAVKKKREAEEKKRSRLKSVDQSVAFLCKKCRVEVCNAQDLRRFKEAHHVVINKEIYERIDIKPHENPSTYDDISFNEKIYCKKCGHDWGVIITVEGTQWPCLKIVSFLTTLNHGKVRKTIKKWKDLPYKIDEFTLDEMMQIENDDD